MISILLPRFIIVFKISCRKKSCMCQEAVLFFKQIHRFQTQNLKAVHNLESSPLQDEERNPLTSLRWYNPDQVSRVRSNLSQRDNSRSPSDILLSYFYYNVYNKRFLVHFNYSCILYILATFFAAELETCTHQNFLLSPTDS